MSSASVTASIVKQPEVFTKMWAMFLLVSLCLIKLSQLETVIVNGRPISSDYFKRNGMKCGQDYVENRNILICIKVVETRMTWHDARSFCRDHGGMLAVINNEDVNYFTRGLLTTNSGYWVGIRSQDGKFQYSDGNPMNSFHRWGYGQPNSCRGEHEACVTISRKRRSWKDMCCWRKRAFVCEGLGSL